jgi:hypothetical protein
MLTRKRRKVTNQRTLRGELLGFEKGGEGDGSRIVAKCYIVSE